MQQGTMRFLWIAVFLIGISILGLFILGLPWIVASLAELYLESAYWQYPILFGLYAAAIPFSLALYQTLKLLFNKNKSCPEKSVNALDKIKYSTAIISVLYVIGMPLFFLVADKDDAPGLILFGLFVIFASLMSAVYATVLQKRFRR